MRVMFLEALKRRNSAVLVYSVRTPAEVRAQDYSAWLPDPTACMTKPCTTWGCTAVSAAHTSAARCSHLLPGQLGRQGSVPTCAESCLQAAFLGEMTAAAEAAGPQLARLVVSVTGASQLQQSVPTSSGNDGGAGGSGNSRTGSGGPTSDSKAVSWQSARLTRAALAAAVPDAAARDLYVRACRARSINIACKAVLA